MHIDIVIAWRKRYGAIGNIKRKIRQPVNKKIMLEKFVEYVQGIPMPTLKNRSSIRLLSVINPETSTKTQYYAKKSTFCKEQNPEKVAAHLEVIKDIPKEKLVYNQHWNTNIPAICP